MSTLNSLVYQTPLVGNNTGPFKPKSVINVGAAVKRNPGVCGNSVET